LISGSADHTCRIWNLAEQKITQKIEVNRPKENELFKYKDHQQEVINYAPEHILNTQGALQRASNNKYVCCFAFQQNKIYTGYEDGLICSWDQ
jgi:WD40 repeat protein